MSKYQDLNPRLDYFVYCERDITWELNDLMEMHAFVFVLDGAVKYEIKEQFYHVEKNHMVYIKPGTFRKAKTKQMKVVAFDVALPQVDDFGFSLITPIHDMSKYLPYFQEIHSEWLKKEGEYHLKCKGLLILILHRLLAGLDNQPRNRTVEKIKDYIVENYPNQLSVNQIAEVFEMSPVYCGALFKKYEQRSINSYITLIRIHQAIDYLENTNMNLSEIAMRIGFNDGYYLSRTFKKVVGITPSEYKRAGRVT